MTTKKDTRIDWRGSVHLSERLRFEAEERDVDVRWFISRLLTEGLTRLIPPEEFRLTRAVEITEPDNEEVKIKW